MDFAAADEQPSDPMDLGLQGPEGGGAAAAAEQQLQQQQAQQQHEHEHVPPAQQHVQIEKMVAEAEAEAEAEGTTASAPSDLSLGAARIDNGTAPEGGGEAMEVAGASTGSVLAGSGAHVLAPSATFTGPNEDVAEQYQHMDAGGGDDGRFADETAAVAAAAAVAVDSATDTAVGNSVVGFSAEKSVQNVSMNDTSASASAGGTSSELGGVVDLLDSEGEGEDENEGEAAAAAASQTSHAEAPAIAHAQQQGEGLIQIPPVPPAPPAYVSQSTEAAALWTGNAATSITPNIAAAGLAAAKEQAAAAAASAAAEEADSAANEAVDDASNTNTDGPSSATDIAADGGGAKDDNDSDSDIEILGTTAAPAVTVQQQEQAAAVAAAAARAATAAAQRASHMPEWMADAAAAAVASQRQVDNDNGNGDSSGAGQDQTVDPRLATAISEATGAPQGSEEFNKALQFVAAQRHRQRQERRRERRRRQIAAAAAAAAAPRTSADRLAELQRFADEGQSGRSIATYVDNVEGHEPTWKDIVPVPIAPPPRAQTSTDQGIPRAYRLSLVSCSEFTITAIQHPAYWQHQNVSLSGLRIYIKKIAREHGGAKFDDEDVGEAAAGASTTRRWRIPLGAYRNLHTFLIQQGSYVQAIPTHKLQIASLGKALKERKYPSVEVLMKAGVPRGIAKALAPYQRGGVDFALSMSGRCLIADEMGLGKTLQAIASMSAFEKDWPLIVFSPSSARYHWEMEFRQWLGEDSMINKPSDDDNALDNENDVAKEPSTDEKKDDDETMRTNTPSMKLLQNHQINVLTSSKDAIFPRSDTRVVICSYGLAPTLIESGKITPGMFKCAIVDESHMLKNKNTKRTRTMLPVLYPAPRCIMLSGTPALARPMELWPQLSVLGYGKGFWQDEADFVDKYANRGGEDGDTNALAELHTLLTSSVMIRRMKADVLKNLPGKERHNAKIKIKDEGLKREFVEKMALLREGKGALGELAREHKKEEDARRKAEGDNGEMKGAVDGGDINSASTGITMSTEQGTIDINVARAAINERANIAMNAALQQCREMIRRDPRVAPEMVEQTVHYLVQNTHASIQEKRAHDVSSLAVGGSFNGLTIIDQIQNENSSRKSILNELYSLTGKAKVPIIVKMLSKWLDDPTKGKLCIFAHHIDILDAIQKGAWLSNAADSTRKFIRIDGSTNPRSRQEQMMKFQSDPSVRIAVLGITAAGVAVTLTASSTVWFAELFWTPAIMIQAEDRCHRIGQQATVKCLYLIAKGTLDEVLWKLVEKKFRSLGEFVEGKENLNIVVHRTFDCGMEAIQSEAEEEDEEDSGADDNSNNGGENSAKRRKVSSFGQLAEEDSIQHDIEELAKEEEAMLAIGLDDEDDNVDRSNRNGTSGANAEDTSLETRKSSVAPGRRNDKAAEAICLLDDSDDEEAKPLPSVPTISEILANAKTAKSLKFNIDLRSTFQGVRLYNVRFFGPSFGLVLMPFSRRVVVKNVTSVESAGESGINPRPCPGDILVKVNGNVVPHNCRFDHVMNYLKTAMTDSRKRGQVGVELQFAENPSMASFMNEFYISASDASEEGKIEKMLAKAAAEASRSVIPSNGEGQISTNSPAPNGDNSPKSQEDEVIEID